MRSPLTPGTSVIPRSPWRVAAVLAAGALAGPAILIVVSSGQAVLVALAVAALVLALGVAAA